MRLTAYKKCVDEARSLPTSISSMGYSKKLSFNPQAAAICYIEKSARLDTDGLFSCEYVELLEYINPPKSEQGDSKNSPATPVQQPQPNIPDLAAEYIRGRDLQKIDDKSINEFAYWLQERLAGA